MAYTPRDFYCINCGQKNLPIYRNEGHLYGEGHKKKLYCFHCKCEVNHLEIRNMEELEQFKIDFENGAYINEAKESILISRGTSLR